MVPSCRDHASTIGPWATLQMPRHLRNSERHRVSDRIRSYPKRAGNGRRPNVCLAWWPVAGEGSSKGRWQGVNFEFSAAEKAFVEDVETFLDAHDTPDMMDVTRENMAQLVDTPARRAFMTKCGERGWLGMAWPKAFGGSEREGIYEYLLNECLARRGAPQIGKGVGIVGKTLIRHGSDKLKREFLPKVLRNEIQFAIGYSEPEAGSDAAAMALKATRDGDGWRLNGQKIFTTSAHFADWYWVGARTDPEAPKHRGLTLFLLPMNAPGLTIQAMPTIGDERTNSVFFDNVYVGDDYRVGELNKGF